MRFETRLTGELIARYQKSGHWGSETFGTILARRASAHPDRVAIVDRGRRVTYGELTTRVDRVAAGLGALGIEAGDVVTIQLPSWAQWRTRSGRTSGAAKWTTSCASRRVAPSCVPRASRGSTT